MPRKTSQAKKEPVAADAKTEGPAPRRSGRAVTKVETTSSKEASRSRRSSTAAQTAASIVDSKTPKGKQSVGSRRDSTSPSDSRTRTPTVRVKAVRRSTGSVNYKESDGEEEGKAPKFDDNFESGEEFDDSESDEKPKAKSKAKSPKAAPKSKSPKRKSKGAARTSRGRRSTKRKAKDDDEEEEEEVNETVDVSDDSNEPKEVPVEKKESSRPVRNRRQKAEVTEVKPEAKPSRRSNRASLSKEEPVKKRPSRSVQAKKYTEDDDEIEEIDDSKPAEEVEEVEESEGSRKRKREASPEEASKRAKEDTGDNAVEKEEIKEVADKDGESKAEDEAMEVDEEDSTPAPEIESKEAQNEEVDSPKADEIKASETNVPDKPSEEIPQETKDKADAPLEANVDSKPEVMDCSKDEPEKKAEPQAPPKTETPSIKVDQVASSEAMETTLPEDTKPQAEDHQDKVVHPEVPKSLPATDTIESKPETTADSVKATESPIKNDQEVLKSKTPTPEKPPVEQKLPAAQNFVACSAIQSPSKLAKVPEHSNPQPDSAPAQHDSTTANYQPQSENISPKENGAHDDLQNINVKHSEQYYASLPGRKYIFNPKLSEIVHQSIKNDTFGFVSYNLASPEGFCQKEKLLNELNSLNAHVVCLQQVARFFYTNVLEPSLDALGYKSVFCQPEESLKGMATFYKSSLFRMSASTEISIKHLIEKEIETSSLEPVDRTALKSHFKKCGNVLCTSLSSIMGTRTVTVANVQIPPNDLSIHALQVSCLVRELVRINEGSNKPLLIGGEFNISENDAPYQLLRDGYLSNDKIEELQQRKDVALPEKQNESLVNLLWKAFQHSSSNLCSCYTAVLDHEILVPETKNASPDLLWYSSDNLHMVGVLDVVSMKPGDHHMSLKADIAFSV